MSDWWSVKMYDTAVVEGRCQGGDDIDGAYMASWKCNDYHSSSPFLVVIKKCESFKEHKSDGTEVDAWVDDNNNYGVKMEWITAEVLRLHSEEDLQVFKARNIVFKRYG
ncbi:hypothetical protein TWF594_004841 [Orbilia oligospora]|uniref:Uncharacterized protein n=1 Tax=Orbilia oligospora TaxID=2813651 RepID=A0A7C8K1S0_ORBOL|nr:hypothetical protein TWF703_007456 [Orbilia oligospora]KAF3144310.1 hypothetical protein TWF594_004841 [Orbilia oligospora]